MFSGNPQWINSYSGHSALHFPAVSQEKKQSKIILTKLLCSLTSWNLFKESKSPPPSVFLARKTKKQTIILYLSKSVDGAFNNEAHENQDSNQRSYSVSRSLSQRPPWSHQHLFCHFSNHTKPTTQQQRKKSSHFNFFTTTFLGKLSTFSRNLQLAESFQL